MRLMSPDFEHMGMLNPKFTCDGENINPTLYFFEVPINDHIRPTKSLVLIMEDPDVPVNLREDGLWVHWMIWNIPVETTAIMPGENQEGVTGMNTSGKYGYHGPCPPDREHRYYFRLYALDTVLELPQNSKREELLAAMEGHVIEVAELMGRYERIK